jgi:hypothetical protein
MTQDTRKVWYWTGGVTATMVVLVVVLWLAGVFEAPMAAQ